MVFVLFVLLLFHVDVSQQKPDSFCRCEENAYANKPFVAFWNSPTIGCDFNFSVPIHLRKYGIFENDHQTWNGNKVTVFSSAQLGLYPYYIMNGDRNYNGGLPQLVDLNEHLRKARLDIINRIPDERFNGLAVIDWEPWRPIWETNWATKRIYKVRSVELVRSKHPHWTLSRLIEKAKAEFEEAGKAFFLQTIALGKQLRPKALWGFYGFPDCFAHEENHYQCSPEVQKHNDRLEWLYDSSTALFPSMYLLDEHPDNRAYVLGRLRETLRFSTKGIGKNTQNKPVFVYHRNIYENNPYAFNFLSKTDLDNTIGVAADIGASGIVIWGNRFDENTSPEVCRRIDNYIATKLGPYLQNKQKQVEQCKSSRCNRRGHCVKRELLTQELLKQYEVNERRSSCTTPTIPLHIKKDQVPARPTNQHSDVVSMYQKPTGSRFNANYISDAQTSVHAAYAKSDIVNITYTQNNAQNNRLPQNNPLLQTANKTTSHNPLIGYNIDLGVQRQPGDKSPVDEFFKQVNDTKNTTVVKQRQSISNVTTLSNRTTGHKSKLLRQKLTNKTDTDSSHAGKLFKLTKSSSNKAFDIKKSKIPHTLFQANLLNYSQLSNEKKSKLVHQLLAAVTGNIVKPLVKPHNGTHLMQHKEAKKSSIVHSPHVRLSARRNERTWLPHMYMILIGVSLGGALMFSLIFVAVYYYISLRNTFPSNKGDSFMMADAESKSQNPPNGHSSPKGAEEEKKRKPRSPRKRSEHHEERSRHKKRKDDTNHSTSKQRFDDLSNSKRFRERYTADYIDEQIKRAKPYEERARSCDNVRQQEHERKTRSSSRSQERTRSRREKLKRSRESQDASEIEINLND